MQIEGIVMFQDREDAARQLAKQLQGIELVNPLVLAIPRGGVVTGAILARELGAELDVVIARKLRAPYQPELALGAIGENGEVYLNDYAQDADGYSEQYLEEEKRHQIEEMARRKKLFRTVRPAAKVDGRTVIVTDDGIATGATMMAALCVLRSQRPLEVIVAVPVSSPDRLEQIRPHCDRVVCLLAPENFWAVGQFYEDFASVEDETVVELLRQAASSRPAHNPSPKKRPTSTRNSKQSVV
jgi:predicted phosphoribosyltransferase